MESVRLAVLLIVAALITAASPWATSYLALRQVPVRVPGSVDWQTFSDHPTKDRLNANVNQPGSGTRASTP